jgi:hemolysin activation/secretion protein
MKLSIRFYITLIFFSVVLHASSLGNSNIGNSASNFVDDKEKELEYSVNAASNIKNNVIKNVLDEEEEKFTEESILFTGFEVTGNTVVSDDEIEPIFLPYYNKKISFIKLRELVYSIDKLYRDKGYPYAIARFVQQNFDKDGAFVKITVAEASFNNFRLKADTISKSNKKLLKALGKRITKDKYIKNQSLYRNTILASQIPGIDLVPSIDKEDVSGSFLYEFYADKKPPSFNISISNKPELSYGSLSPNINMNVEFADMLFTADKLDLTANFDIKFTEIQLLDVVHEFWLNYSGLSLETNLSYRGSEIIKEQPSVGNPNATLNNNISSSNNSSSSSITSTQDSQNYLVQFRLKYPFILDERTSLRGHLKFRLNGNKYSQQLIFNNAKVLKENNIEHTAHFYPNVNHGFHNNTTPRFDEAAADLSWERTIAFFNKHLK